MRSFPRLAQLREGVQEFETRLRVMRSEPREVAPPVAARGDAQVVSVASGKAAQFRLARLGRRVIYRLRNGERESDVAFDRSDSFARRPAHPLRLRVGKFKRDVLGQIERSEQGATRCVFLERAR